MVLQAISLAKCLYYRMQSASFVTDFDFSSHSQALYPFLFPYGVLCCFLLSLMSFSVPSLSPLQAPTPLSLPVLLSLSLPLSPSSVCISSSVSYFAQSVKTVSECVNGAQWQMAMEDRLYNTSCICIMLYIINDTLHRNKTAVLLIYN